MALPVALIAGFLLGSIPTAALVTRWAVGRDILVLGNGNPGAKNTFDSVGVQPGLAVGAIDVAKGALALALAQRLGVAEPSLLAVGGAAVLGHDLSPFLRFRGGQGLAVSVGVFATLFPAALLSGVLVIALGLLFRRGWEPSLAAGFVIMLLLLLRTGSLGSALYAVVLLLSVALRKALAARALRSRTL